MATFLAKRSHITIRSTIPILQRFVSGKTAIATRDSKESSVTTTPETSSQGVTADVVSGAPEELRFRTVRIYKRSKTAMQSGEHNTRHWRIDFDIMGSSGAWENPLMGWASSADDVQALRMNFVSKEDAIHFAEKQGWDYYVQEHKEPEFRKKVYADNFVYSPGKLRIIKTK
ncbi:ETC complex I subunit conserved region-domain-containing protein [Gigaspora rosea]|uniref:NADH dehydrogenase [ubiquinone] iron-sulfur protein 4, mitochondrial n=1 Tax=Gigaspora rosea TaxID=44941 RepID=A0A397U8X2_9GLOM|nr:ETC complex I subunit conserved region-domain-containing protein [Gigaspora rosea]CAG8446318.1 10196_t:CDS:2 [Gigaspora rosea]